MQNLASVKYLSIHAMETSSHMSETRLVLAYCEI